VLCQPPIKTFVISIAEKVENLGVTAYDAELYNSSNKYYE